MYAHALDKTIPIGSNSDTTEGLGQLRYRSEDSAIAAMVDGHVEKMKKGTVTYGNIIPDR